MYIIQQTETFEKWLSKLKDRRTKAKVLVRLKRAEMGNLGDYKSVGELVSEMRIFEGEGYRLYFTIRERVLVIMLAGGNKSTQQADIAKAQQIAQELLIEMDDPNEE